MDKRNIWIKERRRYFVAGLSCLILSGGTLAQEPLTLRDMGMFYVGGGVRETAGFEQHVDQALVHYLVPDVDAPKIPVVMYPGFGLSSYIYIATPDGREGWAQAFARRGFSAYVYDPVNTGPSGFAVGPFRSVDEPAPSLNTWSIGQVWRRWGFGGAPGEPYPDARFPTGYIDQFYASWPPRISGGGMGAAGGGLEAADFAERFRRDLRRRLRADRGAGSEAADIGVGADGSRTAERVRQAAKVLPASWVRRGNTLPINGIRGSERGSYRPSTTPEIPAEISVASDVGNPLHEYCHHLQHAIPGLDELFRKLHRRRTAGEARVVVGGDPREIGRRDQYIDPYLGREYGRDQTPAEVLTMAMQMTFHPVWGEEHLRDMVRDDPELLDLVLGVLFHYDP